MARRLFLLGLALLPILARSETFDIEVLFVEPLAALAITEEQLPLRKAAELPAHALRFDAPRPANPGQAKALWDSIGQGPTLRWVTPGLSPEVDDFLDQLAQLRSLEGRSLETLQSIQTLRWAGTPGPRAPSPSSWLRGAAAFPPSDSNRPQRSPRPSPCGKRGPTTSSAGGPSRPESYASGARDGP